MNSLPHNGSPGVEAPPRPRLDLPPPAAPSSHAKLGRWAVLIVVLVIVGTIAGLLPRLKQRHDLVQENRDLAISTVKVVSPAPGKATFSLTLPAEVKPVVEAPIYARASGYLKKWHMDIGAQVEAGKLLAEIDTPELNEQLSGARAEVVQAEAALALSKVTADRWAELLKTSSVSEQEHAEKQADLKLKAANVDAAKANEHRLEDLEAYTRVTAPFAGIITARDIDQGDLISSGKELFRLADIRKLRVYVRVPQSATPDVAVGLRAVLTVPELPAVPFVAKVVRTAGAIDATSRTLLVELEVDNSNNQILSGSYAQVSFTDLKQDPALVLASNTLLFRAEGPQVAVVGPDGRVQLRNIVIGRDFGRTLEILSGITATDRVIENPPDSIVSGALVRVAETTPAENDK
jgi:RND family efflux transporter MFP subunit